MSEPAIPSSPKTLTDDQKFFRDQIYQLLGWGFALILLEATIILNEDVHFSIVGDPPAGQVERFHPDRAAMIARQTKIVVLFSALLTIGWAVRSLIIRNHLPTHPTVPDWHEIIVGIIIVGGVQTFIIQEVAGVPLTQLIPAFLGKLPPG